jgi:hypothetical protein
VSHENVAEPSVNSPRLFTARNLAERVLSGGEVVPVRESPTASVRPPRQGPRALLPRGVCLVMMSRTVERPLHQA